MCLIGFRSHLGILCMVRRHTAHGRHEESHGPAQILLSLNAGTTGRNLPVNDDVIVSPWERPETHHDHESMFLPQIVISPPSFDSITIMSYASRTMQWHPRMELYRRCVGKILDEDQASLPTGKLEP